ncbi:MAG TPA: hypothetical protein VKB52_04985 [Rhodanobacteraceae bacterium]|nr:hypothetical protein [Rhodanobacteraceae bacterium]
MPSRTLVPLGLFTLLIGVANGATPQKPFSDPRDAEAASPIYALHGRPTSFGPRGSTRGATVPAYGVNLNLIDGNTFVRFDAADPGVLEVIAPTSRTLVGGAFLDNDFSRFYTLDYDTGDLLYLDTSDGSETVVGNTGVGTQVWSGLANDPDTGVLYGVANFGDVGSTDSVFYSIDSVTGQAIFIGSFGTDRIVDIAVGHGMGLFGVDIDIDALIGLGGVIGPLGFNAEFAEGLDFDQSTGVLYFAAVNDISPFEQPAEMYTIDTATGAALLVGGISADPLSAQISAFAIAMIPSGCGRPEDIPWLSFSPDAGSTQPGMTSDVTVTLDATGLSAGVYTATLCVSSNDPDQRLIEVPVEMTVE